MEQSAKKCTSNLKESKSKKLLKSESENNNFIGFDAGDEATMLIDKKKKYLTETVNAKNADELKVSTDEPTVSQSNSNTNRLAKKSQSKSRRSIPENNVKKFKKDNLQTAVESFETDIQDSLELTTPTFNLTSTPKIRRSSGRRTNIDITDQIYKLPFQHGWKRELVYRTLGDNVTTSNRTNRNGDVYYYSPNLKKLRSLREIQEQLDLSETLVTLDSFTFLKQPIGMNDPSLELIREANSKSNNSKDDSFLSSTVKSKKTKTPIHQTVNDFEQSDNENTKMKIRFKNIKKSKSTKENKNNVEPLNTPTTTPEYMAEERQESTISPPKLENSTNVKKRTSEMNGLPTMRCGPYSNLQSFADMSNSLGHIFRHLKIKELLTVCKVSRSWRLIAKDQNLWKNIRLKNAKVGNWEQFVDVLNMQKSVSLDTRRMIVPTKVQDYDLFWSDFSKAIPNAIGLKVIELYRCPIGTIHDVLCSLNNQIEKLNATSIKNPNVTKDAKTANDLMVFSLGCMATCTELTELRIKGLSGIKLLLPPQLTFQNVSKLKTLSLTSIKSFPKDICTGLSTVSADLEILEIGDCDCLPDDFPEFLKRFTNLKTLRLENCCARWGKFAKENFEAIRSLKKLKKLELINIEFNDCVEEELAKCDGIRALLIIPAYISQSATTNCHLLDCLEKLSQTLTHVVWGLTHELLRVTDLFIAQYQQNRKNINYKIDVSQTKEPSNNIPILRARKSELENLEISPIQTDKSDNVDILSVPSLQGWLASMMVNAKTKVIKIPFSQTTRAYLSEQFDDL